MSNVRKLVPHEATQESAMEEWDWLRGEVPYDQFHLRIGVHVKKWNAWYTAAERAGDPRAHGRPEKAKVSEQPARLREHRVHMPGWR